MPMITSNEFAQDLCRALELDMSRIRSITIRMQPHEPVVIEIERHMSKAEGGNLVSQVSAYKLVDKDQA
jgi:hypothetical protein